MISHNKYKSLQQESMITDNLNTQKCSFTANHNIIT